MSKRAVVIPLSLALLAALGVTWLAKDAVVESQWSAGPIRIDGLNQDWQDATVLTDPGSKAMYAIKNDGKNLYLLFFFKDVKSFTTIEYTGLKVYFSVDGKKSKSLGILVTKKPMETELILAELEKRGQPMTE